VHYSYVVDKIELTVHHHNLYTIQSIYMHAKIIALVHSAEQQEQPSDVHRLCVTFMITVSSVFL